MLPLIGALFASTGAQAAALSLATQFAPDIINMFGGEKDKGKADPVVNAALDMVGGFLKENTDRSQGDAFTTTDVETLKAKLEADANLKARLAEAVAAETKAAWDGATTGILAVNETMRLEHKADSWLTRAWRPIFGLLVAAGIGFILIGAGKLLWFEDVAKFDLVMMAINKANDFWVILFSVLGGGLALRTGEKIVKALGSTPHEPAPAKPSKFEAVGKLIKSVATTQIKNPFRR